LEAELSDTDIQEIVNDATTFETPLVNVGNKKVLELFHGPTMAFKDVAARYLATLTGFYNRRENRESTVLVATSGDTGGAIAEGFADVAGTKVVVLYPKGLVSILQQEQLRRGAGNITSVEVAGTFQDCLKLADVAFEDKELKEAMNLTTANSINVGRWLPQTTYYASAIAQQSRQKGGDVDGRRVVVPTGNAGNISAGALSMRMGLPITGFIAANNINDSFSNYIRTGSSEPIYRQRTMSNAMDVELPRNMDRFIRLFAGNADYIRKAVRPVTVTDEETVQTIREVYEDYGYIMDPHTAVAWKASGNSPAVIVSTAAAEKFAEEIQESTGIPVDNSRELEKLRKRPERYVSINNSPQEFLEVLESVR
jgi:threonine synthase